MRIWCCHISTSHLSRQRKKSLSGNFIIQSIAVGTYISISCRNGRFCNRSCILRFRHDSKVVFFESYFALNVKNKVNLYVFSCSTEFKWVANKKYWTRDDRYVIFYAQNDECSASSGHIWQMFVNNQTWAVFFEEFFTIITNKFVY